MRQYLRLFIVFTTVLFFAACSAPVAKSVDVTSLGTNGTMLGGSSIPESWNNIGSIIESAQNYWAGKTPSSKGMFYFDGKGFDGWQWRVRIIPMSSQNTKMTLYAESSNATVTNGTWKASFYPSSENGQPEKDPSKGYEVSFKFITEKEAEVVFKPMAENTSGINDLGTFKVYAQ